MCFSFSSCLIIGRISNKDNGGHESFFQRINESMDNKQIKCFWTPTINWLYIQEEYCYYICLVDWQLFSIRRATCSINTQALESISTMAIVLDQTTWYYVIAGNTPTSSNMLLTQTTKLLVMQQAPGSQIGTLNK